MKVTKAQAKALKVMAGGDFELGFQLPDGTLVQHSSYGETYVSPVVVRNLLAKGLIRPLVTTRPARVFGVQGARQIVARLV